MWKIEPMDEAHYAYFYGIPCYLAFDDDEGCSLVGRNILYDKLITLFTHFHNYLIAPFDDRGFPVKVGPRVDVSDD